MCVCCVSVCVEYALHCVLRVCVCVRPTAVAVPCVSWCAPVCLQKHVLQQHSNERTGAYTQHSHTVTPCTHSKPTHEHEHTHTLTPCSTLPHCHARVPHAVCTHAAYLPRTLCPQVSDHVSACASVCCEDRRLSHKDFCENVCSCMQQCVQKK